MIIGWACPLSVQEYADAGRQAPAPRPYCPSCGHALTFDGSYPRKLRVGATLWRIFIRRATSKVRGTGYSLLPHFVAAHRRDHVEVIGAAITAGICATPQDGPWRQVPASTVRSWRSRFAERRLVLAAGFTAYAVTLLGQAPDPDLPTQPDLHALAAIGAAWHATRRRQPGRPILRPWSLANLIVGMELMATRVILRWAVIGVAPIPP